MGKYQSLNHVFWVPLGIYFFPFLVLATDFFMSQTDNLFERAKAVIPGGVNSPVRAFKGVGGDPIFFKQGSGAYLVDEKNKRYIDYVGSWGPLILGHAHPDVIQVVKSSLEMGMSFGAPTELEVVLAEKVTELMPNIEKVRMVSSGTEATMTAIRLARGVARRNKFVKFIGCYHGHSDCLLVEAGSGVLTLGIPGSPGVPKGTVEDTLTIPFNDEEALKQVFEQYSKEIAGVIVEPIAGNMGCILPKEGYLQLMRQLCNDNGSLLIFDEVMTGFRVALGGAQSVYDVKPDITTLGKVIGGGMPVGAIGGSRAVMDHLAPLGNVYQAGTLSGNPMAMAAGLATLNLISEPNFFEALSQTTMSFVAQLKNISKGHGIPMAISQLGGMFGFCFTNKETVTCFDDVADSNIELFKKFFHGMLNEGIYLAPSAFEAGFVSSAHHEEEIELTLQAADRVFSKLS